MKKQRTPPLRFAAGTDGAADSADQADQSQDGTQDQSQDLSPMDMDLTNHFLIAMPSMLDPIFGGTVIYMCEHNRNGALGVVINKPTDMTMDTLFDRINLKLEIISDADRFRPLRYARPVMFGGPVQVERGFVLHSSMDAYSSTLQVTDAVSLTTSKDVLEAAAHGAGPDEMLVSLGCSGWSAGQLEQEIAANGWLTVQADPNIIFSLPIEERFVAALALLGIDPVMLSAESGRA